MYNHVFIWNHVVYMPIYNAISSYLIIYHIYIYHIYIYCIYLWIWYSQFVNRCPTNTSPLLQLLDQVQHLMRSSRPIPAHPGSNIFCLKGLYNYPHLYIHYIYIINII
jgi:hypothetical protein